MNRLTPILLLLLVLALAVVVWRQTESERDEVPRSETELLEGFDVDALTRIRIDNIERSIHLSIERDSVGNWVLTDPIAYPVREDMFVHMLGVLGQNQAWTVPQSQVEGVREDLAHPRAVLELFQGSGDEQQTHKVEMGGVDADGQRVNVIADGRVLRTMRNLETILETSVLDWRSRRVFDIDARDVREVRRVGIDPQPTGSVNLDLHAYRTADGWRIDLPRHIKADPGYMQLWVTLLTRLSVDHFVSDLPEPPLQSYGLARPDFTLTLVGKDDYEETLEVGKPSVNSQAYFARRSGSNFLWTLDAGGESQLFRDLSEMFDDLLVRLTRESMERILVRGAEWELRLTQDFGEQRWTVAWRKAGSAEEWTTEEPAEETQVDQIISVLTQTKGVAAYLWDEDVATRFPPSEAPEGVWVQSGGRRYGGRIGAPFTTEEGTPARLFLREEEDAVCLVPTNVGQLLTLTPEELLSLQLTQLSEPMLAEIEISGGEVTRRYRKTVQTTWIHADLGTDAVPELTPVIEHLLYLRAERHLPRSENEALADPVEVRITDRRGKVTEFEVGRSAQGEVRARIGSRQSVLAHQPLHAALLKIVGG